MRKTERPARALDVHRMSENLTRWIVGWSAVVALYVAGKVVRYARNLERKRETEMPKQVKRPVSSVRRALDRYGR